MPVRRLGSVYGEQYYGALGFASWRDAVMEPRGYLAAIARRAHVTLPPLDDVADEAPLPLHLNADVWLVACPECRNDYQIAWRGELRLYMCPGCWNAAAAGRWRRYEWPDDAAAIEVAVGAIARPDARNWLPGWAPMHAAILEGNALRVGVADVFAALDRARGA